MPEIGLTPLVAVFGAPSIEPKYVPAYAAHVLRERALERVLDVLRRHLAVHRRANFTPLRILTVTVLLSYEICGSSAARSGPDPWRVVGLERVQRPLRRGVPTWKPKTCSRSDPGRRSRRRRPPGGEEPPCVSLGSPGRPRVSLARTAAATPVVVSAARGDDERRDAATALTRTIEGPVLVLHPPFITKLGAPVPLLRQTASAWCFPSMLAGSERPAGRRRRG